MRKENKNFLYNIVYQIFIFIIPLISTPYVSRILGADNIGIYSYTYSIVYYFMLATMLGINNYGAREIAKISTLKSKEKLSYSFCSMYYLQLFTGTIMLLAYNVISIFFFNKYNNIFLVQNLYLISAILDINWLFFGLEKFKVTITRNIIIKLISLILIFMFVRGKDDLVIYTFILSLTTLASQLYLWLVARKDIRLVKVKIKDIFSNLKPCIILFIPVIAYSIYRVMDKTMLGAISGTTALGYYENAEKIINIPICFINALGTVMLPSMSKVSDEKEIKDKAFQALKLSMCIITPMFFGILAIGKTFSLIFFGNEFRDSGIILNYLAVTIIFSAISNIIRTNLLIPRGKDKIYVTSTMIGAFINFLINILLIPKFGYVGACIGTILAEFSVMAYQLINVKEFMRVREIINISIEYVIKGIIMFAAIILVGMLLKNDVLRIIIQIVTAVIIYFALNYKYLLFEFLGMKKINKNGGI